MPTSGEQLGQKKRQWNPFQVLLNMRREVPEFTRCCFCLPLRRGLLSWGYAKLALNTVAICVLLYIQILIRIVIIFIVMELCLLFVDATFCIVLIVGGHKKNEKVLRAAYIYNIVWFVFMVISCCWNTYLELRMALGLMSDNIRYEKILWISLPGLCFHFIIIFVQIYLILLIRSEVQKLEEQKLEMQFTNPSATEAQCTMHASSGRATEVYTDRSQAVECSTSNDGL